MHTQFGLSGLYTSRIARRTLALTAVLGASVALYAQAPASQSGAAADTKPTLNFLKPADFQAAAEPQFSSSTAGNDEIASLNDSLRLTPALNAMQYGGQRRSGRPRYRGGNQNPDGSNKYEFFAGVGFTQPVGNTYHYYSPNWGAQVGAGRNFNKNVGVNVEFNWDNMNLNGRTLLLQQDLYNQQINRYDATAAGIANPISDISGLDAYSHVWSFSLNPIYNIAVSEGLGAYLTAGAGFYHKITTFTVPSTQTYCDYYYGCYQYAANAPIDTYTSNAPGFNAALGFTYKFSRFSNERLYAEARYVVTLNKARPGVTDFTTSQANDNVLNDFPANSNRTTYFPFKVGIRF